MKNLEPLGISSNNGTQNDYGIKPLKIDLPDGKLPDSKIDNWESDEVFRAIRKMIDDKTKNDSIDENLDRLIRNIPNIIANFNDCSTEEEYRMLAKKEDGTLATIQMIDKSTGFQLYNPIILNAYEYKKFYYETLAYCVMTYVLFFRDISFQIIDDKNSRSGILNITDQSLPHLLGLEAKFVSGKDSAIMEKIIPGYNSLGILDKIMSIVKNNETIIQYEINNNVDVFNYYKNMQKNKEFLMLGRFFNQDEENTEDKNKIVLATNSDNQLCLYKMSNMNSKMNRNICKMIIQQLNSGDYFPRSLQSVSSGMLESYDIYRLVTKNKSSVSIDGKTYEMSCNEFGLQINVINGSEMRGIMYSTLVYADSDDEKYLKLVKYLVKVLNGDETIVDEYKVIRKNVHL